MDLPPPSPLPLLNALAWLGVLAVLMLGEVSLATRLVAGAPIVAGLWLSMAMMRTPPPVT